MKIPRPWEYADITESEQACIKRLFADESYKPGVEWLLGKVCGLRDLSYRPDSQRDTDFAEGKRFVALSLVRAAVKPMTELAPAKPQRRRN